MNRVLHISIGLAAALLLSGCEKYWLDWQMDELCKKDGGLRVFETVKLPPEMFDQNGDPFPGWSSRPSRDRVGPDYEFVENIQILKAGVPMDGEGRLSRYTWQVIRKADRKLLAEGVSYGRSGGDFIVLGHHSAKLCPPNFEEAGAVIHGVFKKQGN